MNLFGDLYDFMQLMELMLQDFNSLQTSLNDFYYLLAPKWSRHGLLMEHKAMSELQSLGFFLDGPILRFLQLLSYYTGRLLQRLELYNLPCTE